MEAPSFRTRVQALRGLARESQTRGTDLAAGRTEGAAKATKARPTVAHRWLLCSAPPDPPHSYLGLRLRRRLDKGRPSAKTADHCG